MPALLPHFLKGLASRYRSLFRKDRIEKELADELRFHLEKEAEKNLGAGMTSEEACYAALRGFGGVDQVKEECRDMRRARWIEEFCQDVRFGLRMLAKNPGFTAVADVDAWAGNWRQHIDLHRGERRRAATSTL